MCTIVSGPAEGAAGLVADGRRVRVPLGELLTQLGDGCPQRCRLFLQIPAALCRSGPLRACGEETAGDIVARPLQPADLRA